MSDVVRLETEGPLAVLTFDSPPLNLFDQRMIDDVRAAVEDVAASPPRALLIRAEGRAFSGGVDVHVFDGLTPEQGAELWAELLGTIDLLEGLPAPIVFAAHALTQSPECPPVAVFGTAIFKPAPIEAHEIAEPTGVRIPRVLDER